MEKWALCIKWFAYSFPPKSYVSPSHMLFTSCDQTLFGCPSHVCPSPLPLHFGWRPWVTCFAPTLLDEWPPCHMLLPPTLWMNGLSSHMLLPHTLDEWPTKSHASPPTLWMNGSSSHMLLLHTLDEWPPSHMLHPHTFGWMAHQVTCFFPILWMNDPPSHMLLPHTLDEWVSCVTICQNV